MAEGERKEIAKKENELVEAGEEKALKPGVLRDDLFEDIVHREYISRQGIDEDLSLRVTPIYDEKVDTGKVISSGEKEAKEAFDKVLRAKKIEHEAVVPKTYPGEEGFDPEKVRGIAGPRFARTLKAIKEGLGAPKPPLLEDVAVEAEERFEVGLNRFLGLEAPKEEAKTKEEIKEEPKPVEGEEEQLRKTFEGFKPHFEGKEEK